MMPPPPVEYIEPGGYGYTGNDKTLYSGSRASVKVSKPEPEANEVGKMTASEHAWAFAEETTFHGLGRINPKKSKLRSTLWVIFFLAFLGYFLLVLTNACFRYVAKDVSTRLTVMEAAELIFPTVTICSFNAVSRAFAKQDPFTENMILAMSELTQAQSQLDFDDPAVIARIAAINMHELYLNATPRREEIFLRCSWKGVEFANCSEQFEEVLTPWGFCFSFNGPQTREREGHLRSASRIGSKHGLWLQMNARQDDYFLQQENVNSAGFKVLLHDPEKVARVDELGFTLSPGRETLVGMTEVRVSKLPPPFSGSNCTHARERSLKFHRTYTQDSCRIECETDFLYKSCNCTPYNFRSTYRNCSLVEYYICVQAAKSEYLRNDSHESACVCPHECETTYYSTSVSTAEYPSDLVVQAVVPLFNTTEDYIRKNFLEMYIYHEALSYEKIEQIPAYTGADLQADIGGNLGLCIGGSFISLLEVIEFLALLCYSKAKRAGTVKPTKFQEAGVRGTR